MREKESPLSPGSLARFFHAVAAAACCVKRQGARRATVRPPAEVQRAKTEQRRSQRSAFKQPTPLI
uniref:Lipoprotein n=1 Tax=Peronospora matthiolae TaxID=2874970 RepID=A0AAV1VD02_9STRA